MTWFIQLVLLGMLLPSWSDGHGLIPGQDVSRFHQVAAEQAAMISQQGWSAWELRPNGWGISGLISAWYALTVPEPWVLVPIQAVSYGVSLAILARFLHVMTGNRRLAAGIVLATLLLPSAAMIYAQPHKDLYVFTGLMLTLMGWWLLWGMQQAFLVKGCRLAVFGTALVVMGVVLAWAVRPFSVEILQGIGLLSAMLLLVGFLVEFFRTRRLHAGSLASLLIAILLVVGMKGLESFDAFDGELREESSSQGQAIAKEVQQRGWQASIWLPSAVDDSLRRLAGARDHFLRGYSDGRSAVDTDVHYRDVGDILLYTPRALQIGLLSPFPAQWLPHPEAPPVRNLYRTLAGVEMSVIYLTFPFLVYAAWCWWRRPAFWLLLVPSLAWVMVYAYSVPVVGALVRYRFPGYIMLLALAVAGLCQAVLNWRAKRLAISAAQEN
ncbi:hypothetical protein RSO68_02335 [Halomonas saccharevitans]|uniref:Dolichyl-phosphate-mannose-protein mannosyltransferase n=1 Tax=Halomonas saccharevitans TaxID=416872 RepID=A0ABU3NCP1_9GAMM|nr:hypothetical protein [Halomonas saccharevitans]MDT8878303.1 hypothetical protein [Halomonas saccharevitans]